MILLLSLFPVLLVAASAVPSITEIITENKELKDEIKDLQDKVRELTEKVVTDSKTTAKLSEIITSYSEQCRLIAQGACGVCLCKDDRRLLKKYYCDCSNLSAKRDCLEYYQQEVRIDGVYKIHQGMGKTIQVYCDQTTDGGGWTVFQRRRGDASVDFYRNWIEYKVGFGDLQHEFWLGNQNLFTLSLEGLLLSGNELRVDLERVDGTRNYAKYSNFQVGNEFTKYLLSVGGYSGDAGEYLSYHNGKKFSTYDQDNDIWSSGNCAATYKSGWWYGYCNWAHLNGRYVFYNDKKTDNTGEGVNWEGHQHKLTEMKMRRKH